MFYHRCLKTSKNWHSIVFLSLKNGRVLLQIIRNGKSNITKVCDKACLQILGFVICCMRINGGNLPVLFTSIGLGTSTSKEAKEYFADMKRHRIQFKYSGPEDDAAISLVSLSHAVRVHSAFRSHC